MAKHVQAVIRRPTGEILVEIRRDGSTKGHLMLPGGGVKDGEVPKIAIVREMAEELGIVGTAVERILTPDVPRTNSGKDIAAYLFNDWIGDIPLFNIEDGSPLLWATASQIIANGVDSQRLIMEGLLTR